MLVLRLGAPRDGPKGSQRGGGTVAIANKGDGASLLKGLDRGSINNKRGDREDVNMRIAKKARRALCIGTIRRKESQVLAETNTSC